MAAEVRSVRRYLFLEHKAAVLAQSGTANMWDVKRRAAAGTAIPESFPSRSALMASGYLVIEELSGADATELKKAGLTSAQAAAVVAAIG